MNTVYIDVLITVNIFIDFFLILCTRKTLHLVTSYKRMIFGSLCGGAISLIALLPKMMFIINLLADIIGAGIIIFVVFGKCTVKTYIIRIAVFFAYSFSFCGIMIFVYTAFKPKGMIICNDIVYFNISPVVLIILTLVCYYILKLLKRLTKGVIGGGICNVEFVYNESKITFSAKIDTGCNLKEPFSGDYVIIVEKEIISEISICDEKLRIVPFESLGGNGTIKAFKPEELLIDNIKTDDVYIGICENILKGNIKALIPSELVKNNTK